MHIRAGPIILSLYGHGEGGRERERERVGEREGGRGEYKRHI